MLRKKKEEIEDKVLNSLNGILALAYNTSEYEKIHSEIKDIVRLLEKKGLIYPRKRRKMHNF